MDYGTGKSFFSAAQSDKVVKALEEAPRYEQGRPLAEYDWPDMHSPASFDMPPDEYVTHHIRAMSARRLFTHEYGFAIFTREALDILAAALKGKRVLDAGSGTGWLAAHLAERGIDITAAERIDYTQPAEVLEDQAYWFKQVFRHDYHGDAVDLLPGDYDAVILSWPNLWTDFAHRVWDAMRPGQRLFYLGESRGGCTADDGFFEAIKDAKDCTPNELNHAHKQFPGIRDWWSVLEKDKL